MNLLEESILEQLTKLGVKPEREYPPVQRFRTGMVSFDYAIGGGLPAGHIVQIYAPESYGKTLISMIAAAHNFPTLYINLESKLDATWTKAFDVIPGENLYIAEAASGEEALDNILQVVRNNASLGFKLIVLDTIAAAYPKSEVLKDMDAGNRMGARATLIGNFLFRVMDDLKNSNCCLLLLNQARSNFSQYGDDIVASGGWALQHASDIRIRLNSKEGIAIKDEGKIVAHGFKIKGTIKKNKTASAYDAEGKERKFDVSILLHPDQFHWATNDVLDVAKDLGIFQKKDGEVYTGSGTICFNGTELGSSRDKARITIDHDDALFEAVLEAIYQSMENDENNSRINR